MKGLGVLLATVAVIMGTVVGLRALIAPDQPTFADALEAADEGPFLPEAVGGELQVTGDREGSFSLGREAGPPGYGLHGDEGRMHFDGSGTELELIQFSYDGLEFFPKEGDCIITPGEVNSGRGVAGAQVECPEIRDIRDTATITVAGRVGLPADMVVERDLPELGGTFTIGDETWAAEPSHLLPGEMVFDDASPRLRIGNAAGDAALSFASDPLVLRAVTLGGEEHAVESASCSIARQDLVAVNPEVSIVEITVRCEEVEVDEVGPRPVEADVVVEESVGLMPGP